MYEPVLLLSGCSQKQLQYAAAKAQGWSMRISPTASVPNPCSPQHLVQLFKWLGNYYKITTNHRQWQDSLFLGEKGWTTANNKIQNYIVIYCWNYKSVPALQLWPRMTHVLICLIRTHRARLTLNLIGAMVVSFSFLSNDRVKITLGTCIFFLQPPITKVRIRCHECFYKDSAYDVWLMMWHLHNLLFKKQNK